MKQTKNFPEQLQALAYGIIRVTGTCIFLLLTFFSLISSQYMPPKAPEIPVNRPDSPLKNLLFLILLVILIQFLKYVGPKIPSRRAKWIERILLALSVLWIGGAGIWWINSIDRIPTGDQAFVYGGASYFLEKDYSFLGPGGYCEIYPYQLGLIALMELFFALVGAYNYYAFEVLCVCFAMGIVLVGYGILKELNTEFGVRLLYLALIVNCIPLICYTSWVYGDIPSIFFALSGTYFILRYHDRQKWYYLAGMAGSFTIATLIRKNTLIFLIALCLLTVVYFARFRKWQVLTAVLLALLCPYLCYQGIYQIYETRSGYEHSSGLSANSWIAMGLQDNDGVCGWYNNMPKEVLYSLSYDYDATEHAMTDIIRARISDFAHDPKYAANFFSKKILSQWNTPLYQSIFYSLEYNGNDSPEEGSFLDKVYNSQEEFFRVFAVADRVHFLVFLGVLFYFLFALNKDSQPYEHLLAVAVIGGFFFSILWEAKARYMFPYYVIMFPLAAVGYFRATDICAQFWNFLRRRFHKHT